MTTHARYHQYRCRDCQGYPAECPARAVCSITSKVKNAGDAICAEGRMRKSDGAPGAPQTGERTMTKKYQCPIEGCEFESDSAMGLKGHGGRKHKQEAQRAAILAYIAEVDAEGGDAPVKHDCTTCAYKLDESDEAPCGDCKQFDEWVSAEAAGPAEASTGGGPAVQPDKTPDSETASVAQTSDTPAEATRVGLLGPLPSPESERMAQACEGNAGKSAFELNRMPVEDPVAEGAVEPEDFSVDEPVEQRECEECAPHRTGFFTLLWLKGDEYQVEWVHGDKTTRHVMQSGELVAGMTGMEPGVIVYVDPWALTKGAHSALAAAGFTIRHMRSRRQSLEERLKPYTPTDDREIYIPFRTSKRALVELSVDLLNTAVVAQKLEEREIVVDVLSERVDELEEMLEHPLRNLFHREKARYARTGDKQTRLGRIRSWAYAAVPNIRRHRAVLRDMDEVLAKHGLERREDDAA